MKLSEWLGGDQGKQDWGQRVAGTEPAPAMVVTRTLGPVWPDFPGSQERPDFFFFNVKTPSVSMPAAITVPERKSQQIKAVSSPHKAHRCPVGDLHGKNSRGQSWKSLGQRAHLPLMKGRKASPGTLILPLSTRASDDMEVSPGTDSSRLGPQELGRVLPKRSSLY